MGGVVCVNQMMPMVLWGLPVGVPRPGMAGSMAAHPRLIAQATTSGQLLTCPAGASPTYNRGDRMEVLRALRVAPDAVAYLVLLPNGCSGWIPASNTTFGQPMIGTGFDTGTAPMRPLGEGTMEQPQQMQRQDPVTDGAMDGGMDGEMDGQADADAEMP